MANGVFHVEYGIELNLTEPDLGHPSMPGLWGELYRKRHKGVLQCLECREIKPDCPEWMYLRVRPDGQREAVHLNPSIAAHAPESDEHKALKERIHRAATAGGFRVEVEHRPAHGRRRTDVLVHGNGVMLGCEPQLTEVSTATIKRRSAVATADGITPLWMTASAKSKLINQAPWARIDRMPWHIYLSSNKLPVRGGVRALETERCERLGFVCPDKKAGRKCSGWHSWWEPRQLERFDDLIVLAAATTLVPVRVLKSKRVAEWFWVRDTDLAQVEPPADVEPETSVGEKLVTLVDVTPRPLDRTCRYGQDTGYRSPAAPIRDDGAFVPAQLAPRPVVHLDWSGSGHYSSQVLPCRLCSRETFMRDGEGRACHKACAELEEARALL